MEILLDTNFIITCIKQKLDFFSITEELVSESIKWILPDKIFHELVKISNSKDKKLKDKQAANLFQELYKENSKKIREIKLNIENVDDSLVAYCNSHPEMVLATLDKKLKSRVTNKILTIKDKNYLQIV